ncbi:hypothetical protein N0V90_004522 [Kalmusia sp. IMI 367209]|nr:hypothetical protein N0V90_004522 [Kalmusia sp. IMI 367209]
MDNLRQRSKQHNPVIARYLGLGVDAEPSQLGKYAPILPPTPTTPPKSRKRNQKVRDGSSPSTEIASRTDRSGQRRVSDAFRVTKPAPKRPARKHENMTASAVSISSPKGTQIELPPQVEEQQQPYRQANTTVIGTVKLSSSISSTIPTQAFTYQPISLHNAHPSQAISIADRVPPCTDRPSQDTTIDEFFDDIFETIDLDGGLDQIAIDAQNQGIQSTFDEPLHTTQLQAENSCQSIHLDMDIFPSTPDLTDDFSSSFQLNTDNHGSNYILACEKSAGDAATTISSRPNHIPGPSGRFVSPITEKTEALMRKEAMNKYTDRKPIVRSSFPTPVRGRSPIIGLSSNGLLRTCFRIGEAINQSCYATKHGQSFIFELYARVLSTERDAAKQHFVFSDLFHDRPPHLKGEYDAAIWKQVELFNYDSGRFLSKARMCRCIGKIKRDRNKEWVMVVLNIWEATWEDIDWVEGIIDP